MHVWLFSDLKKLSGLTLNLKDTSIVCLFFPINKVTTNTGGQKERDSYFTVLEYNHITHCVQEQPWIWLMPSSLHCPLT